MVIFCVTTKDNIHAINCSIEKHRELHQFEKYYIICPASQILFFNKNILNKKNIIVLAEDSLISFSRFQGICEEVSDMHCKQVINKSRQRWYYQQVLKISFALISNEDTLLMWDADSVPLVKIDFFNNGKSISYGSIIEYHKDYFSTIETIFSFEMPKMAYTIQFFSVTNSEKINLFKLLSAYLPKSNYEDISTWISKIIVTSVVTTKNNLETSHQSYFSEQELIGLSNNKINKNDQQAINHFRPMYYWSPSKFRIIILTLLGFKYYTLEKKFFFNNLIEESLNFWKSLIRHLLFRINNPIL